MPITVTQANTMLLHRRARIQEGTYLPWLCFTALEDGSSVALENHFRPKVDTISLKISRDGENWSAWDWSAVSLDRGDKMYLKGTANCMAGVYNGQFWWSQFVMTGRIAASGSVMTLLYEDDPWTNVFHWTNSLNRHYFTRLFQYCTALEEPPELPAIGSDTTRSDWLLGAYCYQDMFNGCVNLKRAPKLPFKHTSPYCCQRMFMNCTSLTSAPEIESDNLKTSCFESMFYGCSSMITGPSLIKGGETAENKAEPSAMNLMFCQCTSLRKAPELRASYIAGGVYSWMFSGCTSLKKAPTMPSVFNNTVANNAQHFNGMFDGCVSLEEAMSSITLGGLDYGGTLFRYMFRNCIKLKTAPNIIVNATLQSGSNYTYAEMFYNCSSLETPPTSLTIGDTNYTCYSMFYGCTSLRGAPNIIVPTTLNSSGRQFYYMFAYCTALEEPPAVFNLTSTATTCCQAMFYYCTSLKSAPRLPATTLAANCYVNMFTHCTSLKLPPADFAPTTLASNCCASMFSDCYSLEKFPNLPATTLASGCYSNMFQNAGASIEYVTEEVHLPALSLVGNAYQSMFNSCRILKTLKMDFTSVENSGSTSGTGMYGMLSNCRSIQRIEVAFEQWWGTGWRQNWCLSAPTNVTFVKPSALPTTTANSNTYLSTWTIVDKTA